MKKIISFIGILMLIISFSFTNHNQKTIIVNRNNKLAIENINFDDFYLKDSKYIINVPNNILKTEFSTALKNKDSDLELVCNNNYEYVGTGCLIKKNQTDEEYIIVVKGDVSKDGLFTIVDVAQSYKYYNQKIELQPEQIKAVLPKENTTITNQTIKQLALSLISGTLFEYEENISSEIKIDFEVTTLNLNKGNSKKINYTITNNLNLPITWSSENENIAVVDSIGVVTALNNGTTNIVATLENDNSFKLPISVTTNITGISVSKKEVTLSIGNKEQLQVSFSPIDASNKELIWTSLNEKIATVSQDGIITGVSKGETEIIIKTSNGIETSVLVIVDPKLETKVENIEIYPANSTIDINERYQLNATIFPENVNDKSLTWSSSHEDIAIVDESGIVTGISPGSSIITATSSNGVTATATVIVFTDVTEIILNHNKVDLFVGKTIKLNADVLPNNASIKGITWTSSNENIATVDTEGNVIGLNPGKTIITATSYNDKTATCEIEVFNSVIEIKLSTPKEIIAVNENINLVTTVTPSEGLLEKIDYSSSNEKIATVDEFGTVTALSSGQITITAKIGEKTAKINLTVLDNPEKIIIPSTATININSSTNLNFKIEPEVVYDNTITWSSNNNEIVTVDEFGTITGISEGSAIITATTINGKKAECIVNVIIPTTSIELNYSTVYLSQENNEEIDLEAKVTPNNATIKEVTWTSSNPNIATVDSNGLVKAKAVGTVIITAKLPNGKTATCEIIVNNEHFEQLIKNIYMSSNNPNNTNYGTIGDTFTLTIEAIEEITMPTIIINDKEVLVTGSGTNYSTTYEITNDSKEGIPIISISDYSSVKTLAKGPVIDKITNGTNPIIDKTSPTCSFNNIPTTMYGNQTTIITLTCNEEISEIHGTLETTDFILGNLELKEINSIKISSKEHIYNLLIGVENINQEVDIQLKENTFKDKAGNINKKVISEKIKVSKVITNIELNEEQIYLKKGETSQLKASIFPEDVNDSSIEWKSSDSSVATVDKNGLVSFVSIGETIISATTNNGLTAECLVTAYDIPSIKISSNDDNILLTGTEVTYKLKISGLEDSSFNEDLIQLYTQSPIDYSLVEYHNYTITKDENDYKLIVNIPNDIASLGLFRILVKEGAVVDKFGNKNLEIFEDNYIVSLNLNATAQNEEEDEYMSGNAAISIAVGVDNSFYSKTYDFYLDDTLVKSDYTTNSHIISKNLENGNKYTIKAKVNLYEDRPIYSKSDSTYYSSVTGKTLEGDSPVTNLSDTVISGYIEKEITIPKAKNEKKLTVDVIDVSEKVTTVETDAGFRTGDAIFVQSNDKNILIDTGNSKSTTGGYAEGFAKRIAKRIGEVSNNQCIIDYLILTHSDADHINGYNQLTNDEGCKVKNLVVSNNHYNGYEGRYSITATKMVPIKDAISKNNDNDANNDINIITITAGNVLNIGGIIYNVFYPYNNLELPVSWLANTEEDVGNNKTGIRTAPPLCDTQEKISTGAVTKCTSNYGQTYHNNSSIVIKTMLGSRKILLTGDAEYYAEEIILGKAAETATSTNRLRITDATTITRKTDIVNISKTYQVPLAVDIATNEGITQKKAVSKYKLNRFTEKIVSASILKKGHHSYRTSTSISFLEAVSPSIVITTGGKYTEESSATWLMPNIIPYLDCFSDHRIREYFKTVKNKNITSTNWTTYVYAPVRKTKSYANSGITELITYGRKWDTSGN